MQQAARMMYLLVGLTLSLVAVSQATPQPGRFDAVS
jgi:hypothetical protein